MERIKLSKEEKVVLRLLQNTDVCLEAYPVHTFCAAVRSLQRKRLARGFWSEEAGLVAAILTEEGVIYLSVNPSLRNPVDWK